MSELKDGTLRMHQSGLRKERTSSNKPMLHGKQPYRRRSQWSPLLETLHVVDFVIGKHGVRTGGIGETTTGHFTRVIFQMQSFSSKNTIQQRVQQF
jgi:hypothetical protein